MDVAACDDYGTQRLRRTNDKSTASPDVGQTAPHVASKMNQDNFAGIFDVDGQSYDVTFCGAKISWAPLVMNADGNRSKKPKSIFHKLKLSSKDPKSHGTDDGLGVHLDKVFGVKMRRKKHLQTKDGDGVCEGFDVYTYEHKTPCKLRQRTIKFSHPSEDICGQWVKRIEQHVEANEIQPKRIKLFLHNFAGRKNGIYVYKEKVQPLFEAAGVEVDMTEIQHNEHVKHEMLHLDTSQYDCVVSFGGDGTAMKVLNGLLNKTQQDHEATMKSGCTPHKADIPLGIIPGGITNHVLQSVQGVSDPVTATLHIILGNYTPVDICSVYSGDKFIHWAFNCHYGFFGNILQFTSRYQFLWEKKLEASILKALTKAKFRSYECDIQYILSPDAESCNPVDGRPCTQSCEMCEPEVPMKTPRGSVYSDDVQELDPLAVSNTSSTIMDMSREDPWQTVKGDFLNVSVLTIPGNNDWAPKGLSKYTHLSDGCVDLVLVHDTTRKEFVRFLKRHGSSNKNQFNLPFVETFRCKEVRVKPRLRETWNQKDDSCSEIDFQVENQRKRLERKASMTDISHDEQVVCDMDDDSDWHSEDDHVTPKKGSVQLTPTPSPKDVGLALKRKNSKQKKSAHMRRKPSETSWVDQENFNSNAKDSLGKSVSRRQTKDSSATPAPPHTWDDWDDEDDDLEQQFLNGNWSLSPETTPIATKKWSYETGGLSRQVSKETGVERNSKKKESDSTPVRAFSGDFSDFDSNEENETKNTPHHRNSKKKEKKSPVKAFSGDFDSDDEEEAKYKFSPSKSTNKHNNNSPVRAFSGDFDSDEDQTGENIVQSDNKRKPKKPVVRSLSSDLDSKEEEDTIIHRLQNNEKKDRTNRSKKSKNWHKEEELTHHRYPPPDDEACLEDLDDIFQEVEKKPKNRRRERQSGHKSSQQDHSVVEYLEETQVEEMPRKPKNRRKGERSREGRSRNEESREGRSRNEESREEEYHGQNADRNTRVEEFSQPTEEMPRKPKHRRKGDRSREERAQNEESQEEYCGPNGDRNTRADDFNQSTEKMNRKPRNRRKADRLREERTEKVREDGERQREEGYHSREERGRRQREDKYQQDQVNNFTDQPESFYDDKSLKRNRKERQNRPPRPHQEQDSVDELSPEEHQPYLEDTRSQKPPRPQKKKERAQPRGSPQRIMVNTYTEEREDDSQVADVYSQKVQQKQRGERRRSSQHSLVNGASEEQHSQEFNSKEKKMTARERRLEQRAGRLRRPSQASTVEDSEDGASEVTGALTDTMSTKGKKKKRFSFLKLEQFITDQFRVTQAEPAPEGSFVDSRAGSMADLRSEASQAGSVSDLRSSGADVRSNMNQAGSMSDVRSTTSSYQPSLQEQSQAVKSKKAQEKDEKKKAKVEAKMFSLWNSDNQMAVQQLDLHFKVHSHLIQICGLGIPVETANEDVNMSCLNIF